MIREWGDGSRTVVSARKYLEVGEITDSLSRYLGVWLCRCDSGAGRCVVAEKLTDEQREWGRIHYIIGVLQLLVSQGTGKRDTQRKFLTAPELSVLT